MSVARCADGAELPPRGKVFAVARHSHVAGGPKPVTQVVGVKRHETRKQALSACWDIDPRLDPCVVLLDKVHRETFDDIA